MASAVQRIVVQTTAQDKKAIATKAKKLGLPISELMRRGAFAYESEEDEQALGILADSARAAAERATGSIDDALSFIEQSNERIAEMERKAAKAKAKAD